MSDQIVVQGGGISFSGLLALVFIILKLCNVINWSWWWVLAPIWIPVGIVFTIVIIALLCVEIKNLLE